MNLLLDILRKACKHSTDLIKRRTQFEIGILSEVTEPISNEKLCLDFTC